MSKAEHIQRVALKILGSHKNGLRAKELRELTEKELGHIYPPDSTTSAHYRNALYNISEIYYHLVTKYKLSSRYVILKPTEELIAKAPLFNIPSENTPWLAKEPEEQYSATVVADGQLKQQMGKIRTRLDDILFHIENTGILDMLDLSEMYLKDDEQREEALVAILGLRMYFENLQRHRDRYFRQF